ncbi:nicotinamide-nucleotide amidase [Enterobacter sp. Ap-916]|uniref:nicotinamide-nucleotide amidase n=1 Tax=unclassified Enterobacter TaxID=2608935 RepID=UPI0014218322|nr:MULTISPECIES: nicotinamide-nucleotide amidase [unclassified Enterobacter]NIF60661.1 nicotinamide-nucleotide amidase [Enterobacter sp. Ap-867]NIG31815.1 nicotinamide-nucleotide amidase [Enterobacter sp. Ap-916]
MTDSALFELSQRVGNGLGQLGATVTTAESCTGGWIAKVITDVAGSSAWFERGFVTYSNEAKHQLIGVNETTLEAYGAVSKGVVLEMAQGALAAAKADYAVSVSGIAGPDGGMPEKPVGTVWFGFADKHGRTLAKVQRFDGDRDAVRRQATEFALQSLWDDFLKNKLDTV